jgi:hypothetical protein
MTAWDGSLSTAVIDQSSVRPMPLKATSTAAVAASVAYPWCQARSTSRQPTSMPPAPGTPSGIGFRPVNPMKHPDSATSSAHSPKPCRSNSASIRSMLLSLAARSWVAGK